MEGAGLKSKGVSMNLHDHTSDIKIDDVRQIVEAGNPTNMGFDFDQAFWRGHSDAEWHLLPHVFRPNPFPGWPDLQREWPNRPFSCACADPVYNENA